MLRSEPLDMVLVSSGSEDIDIKERTPYGEREAYNQQFEARYDEGLYIVCIGGCCVFGILGCFSDVCGV